MSVLFPKITVRASLDFDSLLLPSFLVATTAQQRGGRDQTPYPASPPHHEPSSLWPSSIIVVDRSSRKPPFSSSCPWKKGKEQRPAANRTASVHLHQALPTGSPSSKDQYVSASVFHRCCPLGRAKSTVLVSLTVWPPHPSISAVLGVTAHNPAYRIIT